jgi:signal transduction histidine kinase
VDAPSPSEAEWAIESAERRKGLLLIAVALASFLPADAYLVHRLDPLLVVARLAWVLLLAAAGAVTRAAGPRRTGLIDLSLTIGSNLFFAWIVVLTGGAESLYLPWFLVMPVALTPFTLRDQRSTLLAWGVSAVASSAILVHAQVDARTLAVWLFLLGASGFLARLGTAFNRRIAAALGSVRKSHETIALELAESERRRGHTERLALVGQLAAGVAHEINNPLAFVQANLAFVRLEAERLPGPARSEVAQALHEAERGVERIRNIVRDLKVFARKDQEALQLCYLGEVVADALLLARASALVPIECVVVPGLPPVRAVARHLGQVILNLLVNAADALDELPPTAERAIGIRVYVDAHEVCVAVEDTGPGLPKELRDRVFEPFFTTKPIGKGTGLGLALSREYVERYGGRIVVENREQGGARFTVCLPAVEGAPPADVPWEKNPIGDPDVTPVPRKRSRPRPSA